MMFPYRAAEPGAVVHDPAAIAKLREVDPSGALVRKWIKGFLREAPGRLDGIVSATEAGAFPAVKAAAHSLKNVVGWLGGERLWVVCQALELAAQCESQEECRALLSALRQELPPFEARMARYLEGNVTRKMPFDDSVTRKMTRAGGWRRGRDSNPRSS